MKYEVMIFVFVIDVIIFLFKPLPHKSINCKTIDEQIKLFSLFHLPDCVNPPGF